MENKFFATKSLNIFFVLVYNLTTEFIYSTSILGAGKLQKMQKFEFELFYVEVFYVEVLIT